MAVIGIEVGQTVDQLAHRFADAVVTDDIGLRVVPADVARRFFAERAEWWARHQEEAARRREEASKRQTVAVGLPGKDGMTPFEVMMAEDDYVSFRDEYGRPAPTFLEEALADGQRALAERRAKAKDRAAQKLKDDLR